MRDLHEPGDTGWLARYPAPGERLALGSVGVTGDGSDLAIVTYGNGHCQSRQAQARLHAAGIGVHLRWLSPLPYTAMSEALTGCDHDWWWTRRAARAAWPALIDRMAEAGHSPSPE